ncbi:rhodanese-like domain-containing protein [Bacillus paralicheniformis]|uniref:Rhodanese-like domain-containing protein n=1 Tax=Bacillus paralicheniformis TaxID=1648923 RepID=A0AAW6KGM7_9BACI|nr:MULTISPECIES: rhodanese-like domain-containing protein [Bacillus]MBC8624903.1 rhodanese-like domain-containing protein [Robertmurraya crescens]MBW4885319.1 rhodanese-like domain-containing protein [Bacillus sp. (in: firmicutes)]POO80940.1 rhodanese-like domain-containing protein [Bacillus sp. MBGLi97]ARA86392.1 rhodanese-like domain-containing protein [Bacillus paralicheniformis]AUZ39484.1 rhodanese-like domain-containing protein [Bacillus sp. MBGLi79]
MNSKRSRIRLSTSSIIILLICAALIIYAVVSYIYQQRIMKTLTEEEFRAGYRKAQLIDVREPNEYEGGHILGARNIPLSQLKQRKSEIRPDKPVYLYCQNNVRSGRAAQTLRKHGCKEIYNLKGGFKKWGGKIKTKN